MNLNKRMHTTKTGVEIPLSQMSEKHLTNTIAFIYRKAKEGLMIESDQVDGTSLTLYGQQVKEFFHLKDYLDEYDRRGYTLS